MITTLIIICFGFIGAMALAVPMLKDHEACRDANTLPRAGTEKGELTRENTFDTRSDRVDTFAKKPTEDEL